MIQNLKKNQKGFTLVELIVVIAILGVLAAVLVPQYIQYIEKSRIGVDASYIGEIAHSMELAAASNEAINNADYTVVVTDTAITIYKAATATGTAVAKGDAMYDELDGTVGIAAVPTGGYFKSKLYQTTTPTVTITLTPAGKTSWKAA